MKKIFTIPNIISIIRIFLIPVFIGFFFNRYLGIAIIILVISFLSDVLDGFIARRFNQISELGQILDPVADKLTQAAVVICFAIKQPALLPLLAVFLVKELSMLIAGAILIKNKKRPCPAQWYGKVATFMFYFTFILIPAMKYFKCENYILNIILLCLTTAMMIYAFIRYFIIFLKIMRTDDENELENKN